MHQQHHTTNVLDYSYDFLSIIVSFFKSFDEITDRTVLYMSIDSNLPREPPRNVSIVFTVDSDDESDTEDDISLDVKIKSAHKKIKASSRLRKGEPDAVLHLVSYETKQDKCARIQIKMDKNSSRVCKSYELLKKNYPNDECYLISWYYHDLLNKKFPNDVSLKHRNINNSIPATHSYGRICI